jgi:predicted transcriptional regulator
MAARAHCYVKVSFNLSQEVLTALQTLARKRNVSMTEVLRHAIGTWKYVNDVHEAGGKLLIERADGSVREVIFL